jgi:hypothetical protein
MAKQGKGAKTGRNTRKCGNYKAGNRDRKNRIKRMKKHIKHHPGDTQNIARLEQYLKEL